MIAKVFALLSLVSIACEALVIRSPASVAGTYLHETGTCLLIMGRSRLFHLVARLFNLPYFAPSRLSLRHAICCLKSAANFGPAAGTYSVGGLAVLSDPENACSSLRVENASAPNRYAGAVVFALRGNCSFGVKISNIQAAGAAAAVVGNNDFDSDALFAYARTLSVTFSASALRHHAVSQFRPWARIHRDRLSYYGALFLLFFLTQHGNFIPNQLFNSERVYHYS